MQNEFNGIEKRLDELSERLARLQPLTQKTRLDFEQDAYLRDIVERNLEVATQCCIDICHRIIALEGAQKPADYRAAFTGVGALGVLPMDFARRLAPLAGFRNILAHEYLTINWDEVYHNLQQLDDLEQFAKLIRHWLREKTNSSNEM
jgi:uncharacterized protein YutE (UPF0331/DUF86 family)